MGALAGLIVYLFFFAIGLLVLYFVIKSAVKAAIRETRDDRYR